jgi:hypothetical protein
MQPVILSFRAGDDLAQQTRIMAEAVGLKSSDYLREAVQEKNERVKAERYRMLSLELSADHLAFNESIEGTLEDGLD